MNAALRSGTTQRLSNQNLVLAVEDFGVNSTYLVNASNQELRLVKPRESRLRRVGLESRADGRLEKKMRWMEKEPENQEEPMPLTSEELLVWSRCPEGSAGLTGDQEADKDVIRKMGARIDRYAERQGAYWEK